MHQGRGTSSERLSDEVGRSDDFGDNVYVDLAQDIDKPGAQVRCISTPIVSNDVVVSQVVPMGGNGYEARITFG